MVEVGEQTAMPALMAAKDARVGLGKALELGVIESEPEPEEERKGTVSEAVRAGTASEPAAMGSAREEEGTGIGLVVLGSSAGHFHLFELLL